MSTPWPSASLVSIDVEPGGRTSPFGYIGIAEIIGNAVEDSWLVKFRSPHYGWPATSVNPTPRFIEVWPYVDAFIGERLTAAYGYSYDIKQLVRLLNLEKLPIRPIPVVNGLALARSLWPAAGSLQTVVLGLNLLTRDELSAVYDTRPSTQPANKWLLHDAEDDALANARLFLHAAGGGFDVDSIITAHKLHVRYLTPT
ncbi:hypothetical protein ACIP5Y_07695 [Nocardia sp. NPDC088792]|uniref:3'-5' exonuclease n=1 Tax=Nocardia sp. NPDC088792 TaxID=3364332 RepID=UPI00381582ED